MIGTFYQPSLVLIDVDMLKTLPQREFCAGVAEIIKYGVIADRGLFDFLETNMKDIFTMGDSLVKAVKRSCEIKADIVSMDERETGLRAVLNFGHTVGHAIETVTDYKSFLHGEAIAIGMCAAADLAVKLGIFQKENAAHIKRLIELYNLPIKIPADIDASSIIDTMEVDKKIRAGQLRFIFPESIGKVRIEDDVDRALIKEVLTSNRTADDRR
jgi:3-dehydroquinate synthase